MEKSITVQLGSGLQARPAAQFVQEANRFQSHIILEKEGKQVNAKSIMGIMSLAITQGETIKLIIEGDDAETAMNHLVTFVTTS